jgi:uncharacterized protein YjaG (DUF416 family)
MQVGDNMSSAFLDLYNNDKKLSYKAKLAFSAIVLERASVEKTLPKCVTDTINFAWNVIEDKDHNPNVKDNLAKCYNQLPDLDDYDSDEYSFWMVTASISALLSNENSTLELNIAAECLAALSAKFYPDYPEPNDDIELGNLPNKLEEEFHAHLQLLSILENTDERKINREGLINWIN